MLQAGLDKYDQWWRGELPWSAPEIRTAFQTYGAIATDPAMVNGAPDSVLATAFTAAASGSGPQPTSRR